MTATLPTPTTSKSPTSRRAILAGALGGLGALAASAIGRASPVRAGVDGDVVLGADNGALSRTLIYNYTNTETVLWGDSSVGIGVKGATDSGIGVQGTSSSNTGVAGSSTSGYGVTGSSSSGTGVYGTSSSNIGVYGHSNSYLGVQGVSSTNIAVYGQNGASNQPASLGWSVGSSTGLQGFSDNGVATSPPAAKAKTGVYGYAGQDIYSSGVIGESPAGVGVRGHTTTGYAGYFEGRVYTNAFYELTEISTPGSPIANRARLFAKDNGLGKTQLCVKFANGTVKILTTEG